MFLTLTDAARQLRTPRPVLIKLIEAGEIPAWIDPRTRRRVVKASDIAKHLQRPHAQIPPRARVVSRSMIS